MRGVINELLKVLGGKKGTYFLLFLISINAFLVWINGVNLQGKDSYPVSAYVSMCNDIKAMDKKEAVSKLQFDSKRLEYYQVLSWLANAQIVDREEVLYYAQNMEPEEQEQFVADFFSGDYLKYTKDATSELALTKTVLRELESVVGYPSYIEKVRKGPSELSQISLFKDDNPFSNRNIAKTSKDYQRMKDLSVRFDVSKGITMATDSNITDLMALLAIFFLCATLIMREKELGQIQLFRTMYHGRGRFALSKFFAASIGCILITVLLFVTNYIIAATSYGLGELSRPLQSVTEFRQSTLLISVGEYLVYYILLKMVVYLMLMSILFFICVKARNIVQNYVVCILIVGISGICYFTISDVSYLALLRQINLFRFVDISFLLGQYLNINLFLHPVNYHFLFVIMVPTTFVIMFVLSIISFTKLTIHANRYGKIVSWLICQKDRIRMRGYAHTSIWRHECYKVFWRGKSIFVLVLGLYLFFQIHDPSAYTYRSMEGIFYRGYMLQLEGPVTQEKKDFIEEERQKYQTGDSETEDNSVNEARNYALDRVEKRIQYLESVKKGGLVYEEGYELITGGRDSIDVYQAMTILLLLFVPFTYLWAVEYEEYAIRIVGTTLHGKRTLFLTKSVISLVILLVVTGIVYGVDYYYVLDTYGTPGIHQAAASLPHLSGVPEFISIRTYIILVGVIRMIGYLVLSFTCFAITVRMKSYIYSLCGNVIAILAPIILILLNLSVFSYVLLTPWLLGNVLFTNLSEEGAGKNILLTLGIAFLMLLAVLLFNRNTLYSLASETQGHKGSNKLMGKRKGRE